jgi:hypothetical protein
MKRMILIVLLLSGCSAVTNLDEIVQKEIPAITNAVPVVVGKTDSPSTNVWKVGVIHTSNESVRNWAETGGVLEVKFVGNKMHYTVTNPKGWQAGDTEGCIWVWMYRDGKWHAGPCDYFRTMEKGVKESSSLCVPDGDKRLYVPVEGELIGIQFTGKCRKGQDMKPQIKTDNIAWVKFTVK